MGPDLLSKRLTLLVTDNTDRLPHYFSSQNHTSVNIFVSYKLSHPCPLGIGYLATAVALYMLLRPISKRYLGRLHPGYITNAEQSAKLRFQVSNMCGGAPLVENFNQPQLIQV